MLYWIPLCCSELQWVSVWVALVFCARVQPQLLWRNPAFRISWYCGLQWVAVSCSGLQWVAVSCSGLQWAVCECACVCVCVRTCSSNYCIEVKYFAICVAVCWNVLQCVAVWYSGLQCVTVCCSVIQWVAIGWIVLQCVCVWVCMRVCTSNYCGEVKYFAICVEVCCSVLHCVALCVCARALQFLRRSQVFCNLCCSVLQCVTVCCSGSLCEWVMSPINQWHYTWMSHGRVNTSRHSQMGHVTCEWVTTYVNESHNWQISHITREWVT